jgi:hypothetical protein
MNDSLALRQDVKAKSPKFIRLNQLEIIPLLFNDTSYLLPMQECETEISNTLRGTMSLSLELNIKQDLIDLLALETIQVVS